MPTSATGEGASSEAGFTLVEMLVALAVIALMTGLAVFGAPSPERQAQAQVERFATVLARGADESVMTNRPLALDVSADGFGFAVRTETGWIGLPAASAFGFRRWPEGLDVTIEEGPGVVSGGPRAVVFDVLGGASPATFKIARAGAAWRVRINQGGEVEVARAPG